MAHETINRWLATLTMILVSVVMIGVIYTYVQARQAISSFNSPPQQQEQENGYYDDNGNWCFDPGGGVVCSPED